MFVYVRIVDLIQKREKKLPSERSNEKKKKQKKNDQPEAIIVHSVLFGTTEPYSSYAHFLQSHTHTRTHSDRQRIPNIFTIYDERVR